MRRIITLTILLMTTVLCSAQNAAEDCRVFLEKFTGSAAFQYGRVVFPLRSPISLLEEDGETERTFPFTRDKWSLLDEEAFKEERTREEDGGVFVAHFTTDDADTKVFESGYEESEPSLRVVFELRSGKWYVTDCYLDCYNPDLPIADLPQVIGQVQEDNQAFIEAWP